MTDDNLTADHCHGMWIVTDANGGTWWPNEEAAQEIDASDDPETAALAMCRNEPMRGAWKD